MNNVGIYFQIGTIKISYMNHILLVCFCKAALYGCLIILKNLCNEHCNNTHVLAIKQRLLNIGDPILMGIQAGPGHKRCCVSLESEAEVIPKLK
jgi:hypothetical protein